MTGEMQAIKQDGNDSNGEYWPLHAAVAKAINGILKPFDVHQGPYILIPNKYHDSKLWLIETEYKSRWYREDTQEESLSFWPYEIDIAVEAAELLTKKE